MRLLTHTEGPGISGVATTLGEQFVRSRGKPIEYKGQTVHAIYELAISRGQRLTIWFRSVRPQPRQGLRLVINKGTLDINGEQLKDVVLWTDTAPEIVEVHALPPRSGGTLKIWNTWIGSLGSMDAWTGNSGMLVEPTTDGVVLRCSAGIGEPDFSELVVEITTSVYAGESNAEQTR